MFRGALKLTRKSSPYVASAGVGYSAYWLSEQDESASQMVPVLYSQGAATLMSLCGQNELSHLTEISQVAAKLKVDSERLQKFRLKREAINAEEGSVEMDEKELLRVREIIGKFKSWGAEDIANLSVVCAMTPFLEEEDTASGNTHYERELSGRMLKLATLKFADHLAEAEKVRHQTVGEYYGLTAPKLDCECRWKRMLCWGSSSSSTEEPRPESNNCSSCPLFSAPCRMVKCGKNMLFGVEEAAEDYVGPRRCKRAAKTVAKRSNKLPTQISAQDRDEIEANLRTSWQKHSEGSGTSLIQIEFSPADYANEKKRLSVLQPATVAEIQRSVNKGKAKMRANYIANSSYICPFACSFTREHPYVAAVVSTCLLAAGGAGSYYAVMAILPANFNIWDYNLLKPEYFRLAKDKTCSAVVTSYKTCVVKPVYYVVRISSPPAQKVKEWTVKGASASKNATVNALRWSSNKILRKKSDEKIEFKNDGSRSPAGSDFTKVEFKM